MRCVSAQVMGTCAWRQRVRRPVRNRLKSCWGESGVMLFGYILLQRKRRK